MVLPLPSNVAVNAPMGVQPAPLFQYRPPLSVAVTEPLPLVSKSSTVSS